MEAGHWEVARPPPAGAGLRGAGNQLQGTPEGVGLRKEDTRRLGRLVEGEVGGLLSRPLFAAGWLALWKCKGIYDKGLFK